MNRVNVVTVSPSHRRIRHWISTIDTFTLTVPAWFSGAEPQGTN